MNILILGLFGFVVQAAGVINRLTPAQYAELPKLTQVDEYQQCVRAPGDAYCYVDAALLGNLSDPLYNLTVEYSANTVTHFNHTVIHWGICTRRSCHQFQHVSDRTEMLEACLDDTLSRQYNMTSKVMTALCDEYQESWRFDAWDCSFAAVVVLLLGLNILGTVYDFHWSHGRGSFVGKLLLCFSVRGNWRRLVAPPNPNPKQTRIQPLHGFRTISTIFIVSGHSLFSVFITSNDPHSIEEIYHNLLFQILSNGALIVQAFFLKSGFLLAYNALMLEKKRLPSWQDLPKAILHRWLRLTPAYALVLFYVMSWARHVGEGPFNKLILISESEDCQRDWWLHLLYINNYKDKSICMFHSWYLAADFQVTAMGLVIFCLLSSNRLRKVAIGVVLAIGLLILGLLTYIQNLHPIVLITPELLRNLLRLDPTFNIIHKRGHSNLVCYAMGLALAYVIYNLKDSDVGADKYKKYAVLYWLLFPVLICFGMTGYMFYADDVVVPVAVRVIYSGAAKFIFGVLYGLLIFFTVVKVDNACSSILTWPGWAYLARVTFMVYLVHAPVLIYSTGTTDELVHPTTIWLLSNGIANLCISFALAVPLFIMVEAPMAELVKLFLRPAPRPEKEKPVTIEDNSVNRDQETKKIN